MRVTYDPEKRELTLRQRGLDFEDAATVFAGVTLEIEDTRKTMEKSGSSALACWQDAWWWSVTHRVARIVTSLA